MGENTIESCSALPGVRCADEEECQVLGLVEACLGRFLSCCCVLVFCLLRCDAAQGEVRAACVVPVDPGGGFAFDFALVAPWTCVARTCCVVDEFSFVQGVQRLGVFNCLCIRHFV